MHRSSVLHALAAILIAVPASFHSASAQTPKPVPKPTTAGTQAHTTKPKPKLKPKPKQVVLPGALNGPGAPYFCTVQGKDKNTSTYYSDVFKADVPPADVASAWNKFVTAKYSPGSGTKSSCRSGSIKYVQQMHDFTAQQNQVSSAGPAINTTWKFVKPVAPAKPMKPLKPVKPVKTVKP